MGDGEDTPQPRGIRGWYRRWDAMWRRVAARADAYDREPPRRFIAANARYADRAGRTILHRISFIFVALGIVVVGIILIPFPGPGWVVTIAGLGLLSRESRGLARTLDAAEHRMWRTLRSWFTWRGVLPPRG